MENSKASKVKILVVEDEILVAQDIVNRLRAIHYDVVGIAPSVDEALSLMTINPDIDIALIDIVLKGTRDGIELAQIINETYKIPFIFLTSHADRDLVERAKKVKPYAYILKPFNDRQMQIAIELALTNFSHKTPEKNLLENQNIRVTENQVLQIKDSLFLKKNHHYIRVPVKEILFIQANSNYSSIYTKTDRFVYSIVLKKIQQLLPPNKFIRTHRSYIVNINLVNGFEGNMLFIGERKIPVSKSLRDDIFKLFNTI